MKWHRLIFVLLFLLYNFMAFAIEIKVVSFNIRYDSGRDGVNSWQNRKDVLLRFMLEQDADVICLQEVLHHQYTFLTDGMKSYSVVGNGRNDLIDNGMFWLSENPSVIGSIGWDAKQPRIVTWAKLREKESGKTFIVLNTHFDDIGKVAQGFR